VVAGPLVRGTSGAVAAVWRAAAAHSVGMVAGGAATASLLLLSAWLLGPLPAWAAAVACVVGALALCTQPAVRLPGSHWMVPREWARFGHTRYAAAFGVALGTGVATLLPSPAWYGVLATAQRAPVWLGFAILIAFAAARGVMLPWLTARSVRVGEHPVARVERLRPVLARVVPAEVVLAAALAGELLRG
jgi:hypothetical protein